MAGADPGFHVRGGGRNIGNKVLSCERRRREAMLEGTGACSPGFFFFKKWCNSVHSGAF